MIPYHLKMCVILHCCWRQTDALLIVVFYAIYEEGTQDEKIQYYQIPLWHNKICDMGFVIPHQTNSGLNGILWSKDIRKERKLNIYNALINLLEPEFYI